MNKIELYLKRDRNATTNAQMVEIQQNGDNQQLDALLNNYLQFGTAGVRAVMGCGYSRLNTVTVEYTARGIAAYLLSTAKSLPMKVVIGFDHRHNSEEFGKLVAMVLIQQGIEVVLFPTICHTPLVSFAVTSLNAHFGIMVTASHNPKIYNGLKVFNSDGCQIVSPMDADVMTCIMACYAANYSDRFLWADYADSQLLSNHRTLVESQYLRKVLNCFDPSLRLPNAPIKALKVCYTPMHGVAREFAIKAVSQTDLAQMIDVSTQMHPDPEFPTVSFPNPEEKGAFDECIRVAKKEGAQILFANDPDGDRFACVEIRDDGSIRQYNGNEIGILLTSFLLDSRRRQHKTVDASVIAMTTVVSWHMLQELAKVEQIGYEETLTGFKWLGNRATELEKQGKTVILAYEEAIGFMCGGLRDKDGISVLTVFYQNARDLYARGSTVEKHLEELYVKYGAWVCNNGYYISHDSAVTNSIFEKIRKDEKYPTEVAGLKVVRIRDLTTGYDSSVGGNDLPVSNSTQMITFWFENSCVLTLRTSGTEPKIKWYCELRGENVETGQIALDILVKQLVDELIEPKLHNL